MEEKMRVISTPEEMKIFSDPYRLKIIRTFQKSKEPLTVKGCADLMGEVPAKVHYHVKKLLRIDILELDHIEVINGINAKYYKLPTKSFTISIREDDEDAMYKQLGQIHEMVKRIMDEFKEDFMKSNSKSIEKQTKKTSDAGFVTSNTIYLSEDDHKEITDYLTTLSKKYDEKAPGKKEYNYIGGLACKYDN